ncbi:hypothetical protein INS49_006325 [Diaporthe citri]|uniref:uncharacterized protein n=1 Tax=Diaporthe citri TaxID=83186 RepID=UPI001C7F2092|nr:uncharacterized protein INS49_006325 [Diaporthe citri]KAG6364721.1 hypothetical protein INS49_006325 [Diaporthe citri]
MGILDFVRSDEKRASSVEDERVVSHGEVGEVEEAGDDLHRGMKPRQLSLIIGSGTALKNGGPGSMLIGYILMGFIVYIVMVALGEMGAWLPHKKSFSGYASRFVDPALGFATGWNYFFKYVIVLPNNLTVTGILISYWRPDLNVSIWIVVFGVAIIALNLLHVSFFGEAEFWMSLLKAIVICALILICFIIALGGGPDHHRRGFRYWQDPGAFKQYNGIEGDLGRFLGVWASIVQATFAYLGTELVGVAFGETPNPRKNVPRAVRQTLLRIVFFYVAGVISLGMAVPYNNQRLISDTKTTSGAASPFVIAAKIAGIGKLDSIINAFLLVFTVSAANSDIYLAARTIWALAKDGQAPAIFHKTNSRGVPTAAVAVSSLFIALGFMNVTKDASTVFGYFVSLVTVFGALNWISILVSYHYMLQGMKAQGIPRSVMPYRNPLLPWGAYIAFVITVLVIIFNGFAAFMPFKIDKFLTSYIGIPVYVLNVFWWKIFKKTKKVRPEEMDLQTGRRDG